MGVKVVKAASILAKQATGHPKALKMLCVGLERGGCTDLQAALDLQPKPLGVVLCRPRPADQQLLQARAWGCLRGAVCAMACFPKVRVYPTHAARATCAAGHEATPAAVTCARGFSSRLRASMERRSSRSSSTHSWVENRWWEGQCTSGVKVRQHCWDSR
jgi:hypothetical protein